MASESPSALGTFARAWLSGAWKGVVVLAKFVAKIAGLVALVAILPALVLLPLFVGGYLEYGTTFLHWLAMGGPVDSSVTLGGEWWGALLVWWFVLLVTIHALAETAGQLGDAGGGEQA
jgi:hypothetical protein